MSQPHIDVGSKPGGGAAQTTEKQSGAVEKRGFMSRFFKGTSWLMLQVVDLASRYAVGGFLYRC